MLNALGVWALASVDSTDRATTALDPRATSLSLEHVLFGVIYMEAIEALLLLTSTMVVDGFPFVSACFHFEKSPRKKRMHRPL